MKTVKRVYRKKVHKKEHNADLHALALAMIAIIACMVSLCGASWAWFTASTSTGTTAIHSATFGINGVTLKNNGSGTQAPITADGNGKYTATLEAGFYALNFKADESNSANGYCVITVTADGETAGTPYYTEKINGNSFSLTIKTGKKIIVSIEPHWGNIPEQASPLTSGGLIHIADTGENKSEAKSGVPEPQTATPPTVQAEQATPETGKSVPETEQKGPESDKATSPADEIN